MHFLTINPVSIVPYRKIINSTAPSNINETMYMYHNIEAHSCNHCYCGKAISITYSECVSVASVTQYAKCTCHVILSSGVLPYFSILSHKQHNFQQ
jgi:hypothetical protein